MVLSMKGPRGRLLPELSMGFGLQGRLFFCGVGYQWPKGPVTPIVSLLYRHGTKCPFGAMVFTP